MYPSAEGINLECEHRDKILKELNDKKEIQLDAGVIFCQTSERLFCKGWDIEFIYKTYRFKWHRDNNKIIFLMTDENIPIDENCSSEDVINAISNFITKYNASK
jgi:hypothetical protein